MRKIFLITFILFILLTALLTGCATFYQPLGFGGGYSETQIDDNTFRVNFRGNGYTYKETVQDYLLYRCAEITLEHGYDYFIIISDNTEVQNNIIRTPETYTSSTYSTYSNFSSNIYGSSNTAMIDGSGISNTRVIYRPSQNYNIKSYGSSSIIKIFKGQKPKNLLNVYVAKKIIQYMRTEIKRN